MSNPRIKFARIRQLLLDLGFREVAVSDSLVGFQHDPSETLIVLPEYRPNADIAAHHVAQTRMMLDAKNLLDAEEFDRKLGNVPVSNPAS